MSTQDSLQLPARSLNKREFDNGLVINVDSRTLCEDTGGDVWKGALALARFLQSKNNAQQQENASLATETSCIVGKRVLELGAGTGLLGIWLSLLGAKRVVVTDKELMLPLLRKNITANKQLITSTFKQRTPNITTPVSGTAASKDAAATTGATPASSESKSEPEIEPEIELHAVALDWMEPVSQRVLDYGPFDMIVASDVVYEEDIVQPLLETLIALTESKAGANSDSGTGGAGGVVHEAVIVPKVYICLSYRSFRYEGTFWEQIESVFTVIEVSEQSIDAEVLRKTGISIFELTRHAKKAKPVVTGAVAN